jgi:hypothetical protein
MTLFQYLPFIMILLLISYLISSIFFQRKNLPVKLFVEGLKDENSGHFEEAIRKYENALTEIKNNRFHSTLKNKIIQKMKLLETIIKYKNGLRFTRESNLN